MRELLDTPTQRRLHILEQLNEVSDWISSNELAKENNASLRTINNDVSYLKENWYPYLLIETSKKNGVRLNTQPSSHIEVVYSYVLKNSEAFRLLEAVFFDTKLSIEKWGERLFISESSLYRITNDISASLLKYGLKLEKKPCRVVGEDEFFARFFYTNFFTESYKITDWPFPSDKKTTVEFVKNILSRFVEDIDENNVLLISYLLNVSLVRQSQGFYIEGYSKEYFNQPLYDSIAKNKINLSNISKDYSLIVNDKMIYDLMFSLFYHLINWDSEEENLFISKSIRNFIKSIRIDFDLTLTNKLSNRIEDNLKHIYLAHKVYPFHSHTIFDKNFYNATAIKELYPMMSMVIEHGLKKLEKETDFPWYTDYYNRILCMIMIKWTDLPELLENKKRKVKILVMSNVSNDHADFVAKMVRNNFGSKTIVEPYDQSIIFLEDVPKSHFEPYDFILSTFDTNILPEDKLVVIDDIPSDSDWGMVRKAINQHNTVDQQFIDYMKTIS